jgi:hypothetical protein
VCVCVCVCVCVTPAYSWSIPCLLQRGYEENLWEYFDIEKHNRDKNKPLSITTQTHLQQKIVFTSHATSLMSNGKSLQVRVLIRTTISLILTTNKRVCLKQQCHIFLFFWVLGFISLMGGVPKYGRRLITSFVYFKTTNSQRSRNIMLGNYPTICFEWECIWTVYNRENCLLNGRQAIESRSIILTRYVTRMEEMAISYTALVAKHGGKGLPMRHSCRW